MTKTIYNIPHDWSEIAVLRSMALPADITEDDLEEVKALIAAAEEVVRPKAVLCECSVSERGEGYVCFDGQRFDSELFAENLSGVETVFPYVCTCGAEIAQWAASLDDALLEYYADRVMLFYVGTAHKFIAGELSKLGDTRRHLAHMNPGSLPQWPISQQVPLFELISGAYEDVGVRLSDSYLMLPEKSTSGFYYFSERQFENCQLCDRVDCPSRRKNMEI